MEHLHQHLAEILILLFIIITFLQSGIDKVSDWKGNISWLKDHFSKTFMAGMVPLMVGIIAVLEIIVGILGIIGIFQLLVGDYTLIALYSCALAALTLTLLLFGQRVSKNYEGAFTLTGYFLICILGVFLLT